MKKIFKISTFCWVVLVTLALSSCGATKKIEPLPEEVKIKDNIVFLTKTSFIGIPISISVSDIQNVLNQTISDLIFEDKTLDEGKMELKIWKTAPIKLTAENGKIKSVLPVKIWIKYKYGTEFMGLNDTKEFYLNGKIMLLSEVSLSNWQLKTKSTLQKIQWQESPTIKIGNKLIAITYLINPAIVWFKESIVTQLDESITKTCNFKPQVIEAVKAIATPYLLNEKYETWLSINPIEVYATDATLNQDKVELNLGLKAVIKTVIGDKPIEKRDWNQLKIIKAKQVSTNSYNATIAAITTFKNASRVITTNFKDETFTLGRKKISVNRVEIWKKEEKIVFSLNIQGSFNGTISLSGIPKYDALNQEIYFEDMDYVLNTKNVLYKSASWLLNTTILKKLEENCRYSLVNDIDEAKQIAAGFLNNYSPKPGVYVNGTLDYVTFNTFSLLDHALISYINVSGKVAVKIKGLE